MFLQVFKVFQPIFDGLCLSHHQAQFLSDHGLFDQRFTKGHPLVGPAKAQVHNGSASGHHATGDQPTFVVEVGHNDLEA